MSRAPAGPARWWSTCRRTCNSRRGLYSAAAERPAQDLSARSPNGDAARSRRPSTLMAKRKRPIFYTGGGVINAGPEASTLLRELVRLTGFPITTTLMGLGAFPASDPQFLGMLGMHGTYEANHAMHDCDVMIAIGARFDDRVTGGSTRSRRDRRRSMSTSTRSRSTRTCRSMSPSSAMRARCWRT